MSDNNSVGLRRNIRLYPLFQFCQSLIFWMPVFFLYFSARFSLSDVLWLEAVYYASVVLLEVPSGYFSDRIGRRVTLLISSLAWSIASSIFFLAYYFESTIGWFVFAQILVAAGMAFRSGTDSALLYESLQRIGRHGEIALHESKAQTASLLALALSALVGGGVAMMAGLHIAYLLSALSAGIAAGIVVLLVEPRRIAAKHSSALASLQLVLNTRTDAVLMWSLVFSVSLTVFTHVPYEFLQPYIGFSLGDQVEQWRQTPLVSGIVLAGTMVIGAFGSFLSLRLCRKVGAGGILLTAVGICALIIFAMSAVVHWLVIGLALLRSLSAGIATPILNSIVHQRRPDSVRATYFSVQSLIGRLAFSVTLFAAAALVGHQNITERVLREVLAGYSLLLLALLPLLFFGAKLLNSQLPRLIVEIDQ